MQMVGVFLLTVLFRILFAVFLAVPGALLLAGTVWAVNEWHAGLLPSASYSNMYPVALFVIAFLALLIPVSHNDD